jgi:4-carboxymuconolactone decarboxylase
LLSSAERITTKLTGRETAAMLEPAEAYAHLPSLMLGYGALEQATARQHRVDHRLKTLAELKAATLSQCEFCIDIGSQIARRSGITDAQLLALPRYRDSAEFDEREQLVLDYAVGMSVTPVAVSDELFARLREHFDERQIVELTNIIAVENMRGRFNHALGIGSSGFTEGMVCAVPDTAPQHPSALSAPVNAAATSAAPAPSEAEPVTAR